MQKGATYLIFINSFFVFAINMFAPLYAVYVQRISAELIDIGAIWSFYIFCVGIFTYLLGRYVNYLKYVDYFLIIGFLSRAIGWTGYLFADKLWQIYAIQLFLALGEAFGSPAYNSLFGSYLEKGKFAPEWSISISINSFITGIASFAGALIVSVYGFNALFVLMISLSFVSTILTFRYKKELQLQLKFFLWEERVIWPGIEILRGFTFRRKPRAQPEPQENAGVKRKPRKR